MDTATTAARPPAPPQAVFEDGFGTRHHAWLPSGQPLEVLALRADLCTAAFESALRERVTALAGFQNTCFPRVRGVQRLNQHFTGLLVVSDRVPGVRLSAVLARARQQRRPLPVEATLCIIRQLTGAIALLHEKLPMAHGAIGPERIVLTPDARLLVVDHMLGSALEAMHAWSPERYWTELRVAAPPAAQPVFDQRADVVQIGVTALGLMLDRAIAPEELHDRASERIDQACGGADGRAERVPGALREWLRRMLMPDAGRAFASAADAWADLEQVLGAGDRAASFDALASYMTEYTRSTPAVTATPPPRSGVPAAISTPMPPVFVGAAQNPHANTATAPASASIEAVGAPTVVSERTPPSHQPPPSPLRTIADGGGTAPPVHEARTSGSRRWLAAAAVIVVLAGSGALFGRRYVNLMPRAAAEAPGTLAVTTSPPGVQVLVDGQPRGVTPLTVEVAAGAHELKLSTAGEPRIIPFTVASGSTVAHTIELPSAAPQTGQLAIRTDPAGAQITIDGAPVGISPLTVDGLAPGAHTVGLTNDVSSVSHEVIVEAGSTASLVVPLTPPQGVPVSGWISIAAPVEVQIYEDTRLVGTSQSDRIMMSTGRHDLTLVNEALAYREPRTVTVAPGKVAALRLDWPNGTLAVNAQPWAAVWIDGESAGETPIGNIAVPIGSHEVVFRHPQLGERVVRVTVTAAAPARVSVDLNKR